MASEAVIWVVLVVDYIILQDRKAENTETVGLLGSYYVWLLRWLTVDYSVSEVTFMLEVMFCSQTTRLTHKQDVRASSMNESVLWRTFHSFTVCGTFEMNE